MVKPWVEPPALVPEGGAGALVDVPPPMVPLRTETLAHTPSTLMQVFPADTEMNRIYRLFALCDQPAWKRECSRRTTFVHGPWT
jgi:hypothetical protein